MKDRYWQNYFYFPGIFIVALWFITSFLDLFPVTTRSIIQQGRWFLVLAWLGLQLFQQRDAFWEVNRKLLCFVKFPHFYYLLYSLIALLSAIYYGNRVSIWTAVYLVIFSLIAIILTYQLAKQPVTERILLAKRLWDFTIFLLFLRMIVFFVAVVIFWDRAVIPINIGPMTLLRVSSQKFWGYVNANTVGYIGALLFVVAINRIRGAGSFRVYWLMVGAVGSGALLLGYSRTAFVALAVVLIVYLLLHRKLLWLLAILFIAVVSFIQVESVTAFFLRGQELDSVRNFNNRLYVWDAARVAIQESPLTGHGYLSGEQQALKAALDDLYPNRRHPLSSHSSFLSILVGNGLLGFVPLLITLLLIGWHITIQWRLSRDRRDLYTSVSHELLAVFIILFVSSLILNSMLYLPIGIRNLPLLPLLIFAGLAVNFQRESIPTLPQSR